MNKRCESSPSNDHVASLVRSGSEQRFCDSERRTSVAKADLDRHAWSLDYEKVA
jgi:hypothetical protein